MCLETLGKHERALSGLLRRFRLSYVRVYKGRFDVQNKIQAVPSFATKLRITERATQCVELANEGHVKHRASCEVGVWAHCGREGGNLYPDRIGCEMVARGASGVRG